MFVRLYMCVIKENCRVRLYINLLVSSYEPGNYGKIEVQRIGIAVTHHQILT